MHEAIAIIGMGAQFPGASDLQEFRELVRSGAVQASPVPLQRWDHAKIYSPNPRESTKTAATKGAFVDNIDLFAPEFFGVTPKRAKSMDPQQRLVLEVTRQALEDAGYADRSLGNGKVGVFVGSSSIDHRLFISSGIAMPCDLTGRLGAALPLTKAEIAEVTAALPRPHAYTIVGNQSNMIAANVSQAFDFHGPSFTIDTACSSALAALHEATLHLRAGLIEAAVVSGVYAMLDPAMLVCFSRVGAISSSDSCRPFQDDSDGFVLGEGAGTVILKRLDDAVRDGDRVVAVIRGVAMNNDGRGGGPLTPTVEGETAVIRSAWQEAALDPLTVGLLEAHATGTQAGDEIELRALANVFGETKTGPIPITSIKSSIGHGLSSAGIASLIKAALAVDEGFIPPQVVAGELRLELSAARNWLRVPTALAPWTATPPATRRAGISAFGFGGTNVHVVLEQMLPRPESRQAERPLRFALSAPTLELLASYLLALGQSLARHPERPEDVSYTLSLRRADRHSVSFGAASEAELALEIARASIAVQHGELPSSLISEIGKGRLVSLPPSPLAKRRFWLLDTEKASNSEGPASSVKPTDALLLVTEAIASVTGRLPENISAPQRLVADLAFDSLATLELIAALSKNVPGLPPPPRTLFTSSLTVQDLAAHLEGSMPSTPGKLLPAFTFDPSRHPWLREHRPGGRRILPLAGMVAGTLDTLEAELHGPVTLLDFNVNAPVDVETGSPTLTVNLREDLRFDLQSDLAPIAVATGYAKRGATPLPLLVLPKVIAGTLALPTFYSEFSFHGSALRSLTEVPLVGETAATGYLRAGEDPVLILDGALQLALYWIEVMRHGSTFVTGFESYRSFAPWPATGRIRCVAVLGRETGRELFSDFDFIDASGALLAQWRGVRSPISPNPAEEVAPGASAWPEIRELDRRKAAVAAAGFRLPYFTSHDGIAGATTQIEGRPMVNFSSYNYLGLAGAPEVNEAALQAIRQYGTSASASRVASGERPPHADLERAIAQFMGCEDAITLVSGHATNVTLIGHLFGPEDLVIHDSLAHDCIISGARLSGAKRLVFPHNDTAAIEAILRRERPNFRRVLIAVEGVYSMDGDLVPLPEIIRLKHAYNAVVLVDEAHSVGVVGATGRGVGEHFQVERNQVDFWMGTLSKAFASCGGFIAGSAEMVDYLRYTLPGFIYSVGLPPATAAAAAAAIRVLEAKPELARRLQVRSDYFRARCRERGVDIGLSEHSAVVPCIVGSTENALRLSESLEARGINVQPIFFPAVEDGKARLRFFITADHTEEQLLATADALASDLSDNGVTRLQTSR